MTDQTAPLGTTANTGKETRSIGELVASISEKFGAIIRDEVAYFKAELNEKIQGARKAVILLAAAGILALYMLGVLLAAAVLGLAQVFSPWLAALIVGGALLLIIAGLALAGLRFLKQGKVPSGEEIKDHVKDDVEAVKKGFSS